MSNGRRFRRGGSVFISFADTEGEHDCPVCRAMGQHVEEDGTVVQVEGAPVDTDEAVRLILERGEWEWG